jgi:hypothetical protein
MKVFDYSVQNKGAAIDAPSNSAGSTDLFTYIFADTDSNNMHVCCDQNDGWIKQRDNGKTFNVDASIIARLTSYTGKPRA